MPKRLNYCFSVLANTTNRSMDQVHYPDQSADAIIPRHTHVTPTDDVIPINDVTMANNVEGASAKQLKNKLVLRGRPSPPSRLRLTKTQEYERTEKYKGEEEDVKDPGSKS